MGLFGPLFGDTSSSSSSSSTIITNNTTTRELIRQKIVALIHAITPTINAGDKFVAYRNELGADFRAWARANPAGCIRRYQVRDTGKDPPSDVANIQVESKIAEFEILVAYAQSHRWGNENGLDRDDAIDADKLLIKQAVGRNGYANFTGASNPNAAWFEEDEPVTERRDGVDFLVIKQRMRFYQRTVP